MKRSLVAAALCAAAVFGVRLETRPPAPHPMAAPVTDEGAGALGRGRAVYGRYGCSTCHGADGRGGFANPNAETDGKVPAVIFVAEGYTRPELRKKILDGQQTIGRAKADGPRPPYRMPGWSGQMTDAEATDLVEFLFSLYPKTESQKWR